MDSQMTRTGRPALLYVGVFFILAVITVLEIILASPGAGLSGAFRTSVLLVLSLSKASLVAVFYMHLRSDSKLYTAIFLLPVVLLLLFAYLMLIS
jgi:caa(3)-type oxidase subunit IV